MSDNIPSEHYEQVRFVGKFKIRYPGVRIFAIPNGGHRGKLTATKMKNEGVSSGVPDLYIPAWKLWVEMKRVKGGSVSPDQKDWHDYLKDLGDSVMVCRGSDEALDMVASFVESSHCGGAGTDDGRTEEGSGQRVP